MWGLQIWTNIFLVWRTTVQQKRHVPASKDLKICVSRNSGCWFSRGSGHCAWHFDRKRSITIASVYIKTRVDKNRLHTNPFSFCYLGEHRFLLSLLLVSPESFYCLSIYRGMYVQKHFHDVLISRKYSLIVIRLMTMVWKPFMGWSVKNV